MVDVTRAVKNGYAMMAAAYREIGESLPPYEEAIVEDIEHYTEIVEFFIERPDAPLERAVEAFHEAQDDGVPYASLPMEARIMYTRLRRAALEAVREQGSTAISLKQSSQKQRSRKPAGAKRSSGKKPRSRRAK
jgi:hypothetical protein